MPSSPSVLSAARQEFAANGLRGARVERIAAGTGVDPETVLDGVGSIEALFDQVLGDVFASLAGAVDFDPTDLPRFAGDLFDVMRSDDTIVRLAMWQRLERPEPDPQQTRVVDAWLHGIADSGGGADDVDAFGPEELLSFAVAIASAELAAPTAVVLRQRRHRDSDDRRAHVEEAMRHVVGYHA